MKPTGHLKHKTIILRLEDSKSNTYTEKKIEVAKINERTEEIHIKRMKLNGDKLSAKWKMQNNVYEDA